LVVIAVLLGYPLSFGPACALVNHGTFPPCVLTTIFKPFVYLAFHGPEPVQKVIWIWTRTCGDDGALGTIGFEEWASKKSHSPRRYTDMSQ
jgi:hypothetical protein